MRCLVTGASGHLGSYLTRRLLEEGHTVTVVVRPQSDLWRLADVIADTTVIRSQLEDIDQVESALMAAAPEVVFHLAWQGVTSKFRNDFRQIESNLLGSVRLLEIVQQAGCKCWVGCGSQAEYGLYEGVIREDLPLQPMTLYGATKLCVGFLTRQLCDLAGTRYVWLRVLAAYGPKDDPVHLIPAVILKLLAGEKPALTPGEQRWDYLYVEDVAEAACEVIQQPRLQGIYNLGSGQAYTVRDIVTRMRDMIDPGLPLGIGEIPYGPNQIMRLQGEGTGSPFYRETGWKPKVGLDEGLQLTVDWFRANGQRYGL